MDLISIIVPVYGVEEYLDRCIKSLVNQKNVNIEIILVDDGAIDRSPQICDAWAKRDDRIKVIHKQNGGLSDARNTGIKIANGRYIAFVDSDDWIEQNLYRTLLDAINKTKSDIACCKIARVQANASNFRTEKLSGNYEIYSTNEAMYELIMDRKIQQVVWNKLYKREALENIWFEVGKYNEDEFWSYQVIGQARQVVVVDYVGYYYLQRSSSIMGSRYSARRLDAVEAKTLRQSYLEKFYPSLEFIGKINLLYTCLYHGQQVLKYMEKTDEKNAMDKLQKTFRSYRLKNKEILNLSWQDRTWFYIGEKNFKLTCYLRNLLKVGC